TTLFRSRLAPTPWISIMLGVFSATTSSVSCLDCAFSGENTAGAAIDVANALDDARNLRRFMLLISPSAPTSRQQGVCQRVCGEISGLSDTCPAILHTMQP